MTGKEVEYRTLEFKEPDRITIAKGPKSDMVYIGYRAGYYPSNIRLG